MSLWSARVGWLGLTVSVVAAGALLSWPAQAPAGAAPGVQSSHTSVAGTGDWSAPTWLVVLEAFAAVLGLAGVLWSERELRRRRVLHGVELVELVELKRASS